MMIYQGLKLMFARLDAAPALRLQKSPVIDPLAADNVPSRLEGNNHP
jgi:hypothetical protein